MIINKAAGMGAYSMACKLLAMLFVFVFTIALARNLIQPYSIDFASYWAAAVLALAGDPASAYNIEVHAAIQNGAAPVHGGLPFAYPPPFLILLLPFGLLPYAVAAALWAMATFALYFAIAKRLAPEAGWMIAAFPAVLMNAILAQNGFLTAALLIAGLMLLPRRPLVAGLVLGCLVFKPHLGLLLPLAFAAARQWRAFVGAALSATGLLLLGLLMFGLESYSAWLAQAPFYARIVADGLVPWYKMASVYASLRLAGLPSEAAWTVHIVIALAAAGAVWRIWRSDCPMAAKGAALAAATALISPYLYVYDTLILIIPFLWLATVERNRILLAVLWCIPLISFAQSWGLNDTVNLMPVMPMMLLLLIARQLLAPQQGQVRVADLAPMRFPRAPAPSAAQV